MRRSLPILAISLIAVIVFGNSSSTWAGKKPKVKRYKEKSGIIEMISTGTMSGKETIYFDNWGWLEAKYTETTIKVAGFTQKTKQLTLLDGEWTYNIDLNTNKGTKMKTPLFDELNASAKSKGNDLTDTGEEMMKQMGARKVGKGVIAGKNCDIWEIKDMGTKTWVYNGVGLKVETGFAGMKIVQEAKSAKFNVAIPAGKLKLPANATITEGPDISDIMKGLRRK